MSKCMLRLVWGPCLNSFMGNGCWDFVKHGFTQAMLIKTILFCMVTSVVKDV